VNQLSAVTTIETNASKMPTPVPTKTERDRRQRPEAEPTVMLAAGLTKKIVESAKLPTPEESPMKTPGVGPRMRQGAEVRMIRRIAMTIEEAIQ